MICWGKGAVVYNKTKKLVLYLKFEYFINVIPT